MTTLADSLPVNFMIPEPTLTPAAKSPKSSDLIQMLKDGSFTESVQESLRETRRFFVQRTLEYVPYTVVIRDSLGSIIWYNKKAASVARETYIPNKAFRYIPEEKQVAWPLNTDTYYSDDMNVIRTGKALTNIKRVVVINGVDALVRVDKIPYRDHSNVIIGVLVLSISMQEKPALRKRYENKVNFFVSRDELLEMALQSRLADQSYGMRGLHSGSSEK